MKTDYLSKPEMKALDDLKSFHGGAKKIDRAIESKRQLAYRKKVAAQKGFGKFLDEVEYLAKSFPAVAKFKDDNHIKVTKKGIATTQVSAWQGYKVTYEALKRLAGRRDILLPLEMISVMPLSDDYVYGGDLLTTLAMCENILGARFCSSSLLGTPLMPKHFENIRKATGLKIATVDTGNGLQSLPLQNMGTFFGNICGIEVGNDNHLVYIDSITRTALETGVSFFLNPSWATIVAGCYYARDIANIYFKISCFLGLHNLIQFRLLLGILKEFKRRDGTTPVREINLGNAINAEKFMACQDLVNAAGIKGLSLTAHIAINTDLGAKDYDWFKNALKVLESGYDITLKYESAGECGPDDTIASYFLPKDQREAKADALGEALARKVIRCDRDAKTVLKQGHDVRFAAVSERC